MDNTNRGILVFTTLAMNQTLFFAAIGKEMIKRGFKIAYICFHERSADYLAAQGLTAFNIYECAPKVPESYDFKRFNINNPNLLISHEKVAFGLTNSKKLLDKFWRYLHAVDSILKELRQLNSLKMAVVQEFGGFVSILATFYAARKQGINNIFIEPSFFRGRVMLTNNSFVIFNIPDPTNDLVTSSVMEYINETLATHKIVIPQKDSHHYRSAIKKLTDIHHIRRLYEKLIDKHVFQKKEEFSHIGYHIYRHAEMLVNNIRLKRYYRNLPQNEPFIYYPLHVPNDAALTIRSPEYLDQYSLLDYIVRMIPIEYKLVIKEHPALVGAVNCSRVRELLTNYDNLIILDPSINNFNVMASASAVITVNSKSGAEAILLGKPVVVLGNAFYRNSKLVLAVDKLTNLSETINRAVKNNCNSHNRLERYSFFQQVWNYSRPGELYYLENKNIVNFSESLKEYLDKIF